MNRLAIFSLFSILLAAVPAQAATVIFTSTLNGANAGTTSNATGTALMSFNDVTNLFDLSINVTGLNKTTLTNSHIHLGEPGVNGGIIFGLGTGSSANWTNTATGMSLALTGQSFPTTEEADLLAGNTYINLHTAASPLGAIRGQLTAVPLPAAAWLLISGLIGLAGVARRKALPLAL